MVRNRPAVLIVLVSVFARLLWALDANPLLLIFDAYVTFSTTAKNDNGRRVLYHTPLEGKAVWVTGSSSGIGAELAIQLASAGVGHLILSGRNVERLESVAKTCREAQNDTQGMRVSIVPFDTSAGTNVLDDAVSTALEAVGPSGVDILVLNAGQYQCSPALETDLDSALPDLMRVNFESPVQLSQKLLIKDKWKERGHGHIVTIASLMGRGASPLNALYASTKHALRGYFHSLAAEEGSWLRVDVVLPGATDTGLWAGSWNAQTDPQDGNNSDNKQKALYADDRSKMSVRQCTQLIISSMLGPSSLFFETWITRNPGLLWVYLASYEPMTFRLMTNIIAPLRMSMWRKTGEDALYLPTLLSHLWDYVVEYFRGI